MDCNAVRSYLLGIRREKISHQSFNLTRLLASTMLGVSLLVGFDASLSAAEPLVKEVTIKQGAISQRYLLSQDLVLVREKSGLEKFVKVAAQADMAGLQAQAVAAKAKADDEVFLVLLDQRDPQNEAKRVVLAKTVVLELAPEVDDKALAASIGAVSKGRMPFAPTFCVFETTALDGALTVSAALKGKAGVISAEPEVAIKAVPFFTPNDTLFPQQWHLRNTGQNGAVPGIDINVASVWDNYRGTGIRILVVDDSMQVDHPDLVSNVNMSIAWDYRSNDNDPSPAAGDNHGTAVSGIVAARGNNNLGVTGVAFESTISGVRFVGSALPFSTFAQAIAHSNSVVDVSNNSWGFVNPGVQLPPIVDAALASATAGRNGLGKILVFAAGNGGPFDDVNLTPLGNSIYTIAVGALNDQGVRASYSTPGSALLVCAPSGRDATRPQGSTTTDVTGTNGYNPLVFTGDLADQDYTQFFNGTSSATPVVSGVIALMLQANPNLGWRDVREILIRSSRQVDSTNPGWVINGAGFHFSNDYGAGMVDAAAAVTMAKTWTNLGAQVTDTTTLTNLSVNIPDNNATGVSVQLVVTNSGLRVEHVKINLDILHTYRGDLEIFLTSPSGTTSRLVQAGPAGSTDNYLDFPFMTVQDWGESANGVWTLRIADRAAVDVGTLIGARMTVYGSTTLAGYGLSVSDPAPVVEGNTTTNVTFNVQLAQPSTQQVTVNYLTASGRAKQGEDFVSTSGVLVFPPGSTNQTVTVSIIGDLVDEPDESFSLVIYSATNAVISRAQGFATIIDDDPQTARLSVTDGTITEGDSGTKDFIFNVRLSERSGQTITVNYGTAPGSASVGLDYLPQSGTLAFSPGETNKQVVVKIIGDTVHENTEDFFLNIGGATFAIIEDDQGKATILDNDAMPTVSVSNAAVVEGDTGTSALVFNLTLSNASAETVTVDYATADDTATVADGDYTGKTGTATFEPGQTTVTVTVDITADLVEEGNETLFLNLSNPVNAGAGTMTAVGTILNDDGPHLSIAGTSVVEGATNTTVNAVFTVTLIKPNANTVSVDYQVIAGSATAGADYQPVASTLVFPPGTTSQDITVVVNGDSLIETNETFTVRLSNVVNGTITVADATGVIIDDDAIANLAISQILPATNIYVGYPFTVFLSVTNQGPFNATNVVVTQVLPAGFTLASSVFYTGTGVVSEASGTVTVSTPVLTNGGKFEFALVVNASVAGDATFEASVTSTQYDNAPVDNTASEIRSVVAPVVSVAAAGSLLVAESFVPPNRGLDPGETVTVTFKLQNTGNIASTNIVAELRSANGVLSLKGPQTYGVIPPNGSSVGRDFAFTVQGADASTITAVLDVYDVTATGTNALGTVSFAYQLGEHTNFVSATAVTIPTIGQASVYPTTINVAGLQGRISKVKVKLTGLSHTFPDDLDILLVAPGGKGVVLMSDAGAGADITAIDLTFDDAATAVLPDANKINAGTYRPTNYGVEDTFSGAPAGPYAGELAAFIGAVPNGDWQLYVVDDGAGDGGSLAGWSLEIVTTLPADPVAELAIIGSSTPNPAYVGQTFAYSITVTNMGPATANNLRLTSTLPDAVSVITSTPAVSFSAGNVLSFNLGSLAAGSSTTVTLQVASASSGSLTNVVAVVADEIDLQAQNSTVALVTRVNRVAMLSGVTNSLPNGQFSLNISGQAGLTYVVEVSTNLVNWAPVFTNTTLDGVVSFTDTNAASAGVKFYRAVER